jgi:GNAT superfamily N-acetyltransferase
MALVIGLDYRVVRPGWDTESISEKLWSWWAAGTKKEPHMLTMTEADLQKAHASIFVLGDDSEPVAAAAIFPARNKEEKEIYFNDKLVVELGSNYIAPEFRNNGLGKDLVIRRVQVAYENGWLPVSVTTNPAMHKIFRDLGAEVMDNNPIYRELRHQLCLCKEENNDDCKLCPLKPSGGWLLKPVGE